MYDRFDWTVGRTLRKLAKQRIRVVLQPGDLLIARSHRMATLTRRY